MVKRSIGKNTSKSDSATLRQGLITNSTTSTTILDVDNFTLPARIKVIIYNAGNKDVWIKFQAASIDNDKKGFVVLKDSVTTILEGSDIYTGEISAISTQGLQTLYITSY